MPLTRSRPTPFINTVLDPAVSLKELTYIGYDTAVNGVADAANAAGVEMPEFIFFTTRRWRP